ncbi:MAG: hypothetical protein UV23_C0040G0006 [Candidatus Nomurabacteria bacterium GW2011_GWF1_42_40]|nr:MAG: hypothetical protein UV23_C0040G0006 [Candidatus Nomurabacteria bacterium GW2011_GWF1_42_40]
MAKNNQTTKVITAIVLSKTLSGGDCIVSLQEDQGRVHTVYLSKEESSKIDLGHKLKLTIEKVED